MVSGLRLGLRIWLLLLSFVSAAPIALFSSYAVFQFAQHQRREVTQSLDEHARIAATAIGLRLEALVASLTTLAQSDAAQRGDLRTLHATARRVQSRQPGVAAIVLIGPDGGNLFNSNLDWGAALPVIPAQESTRRAFQTGEPSVSDLFIAPIRQIPVTAIDVPVAVDGRIPYVLRVTLTAQVFGDAMDELGLPAQWTVVAVDAAGTIVARNRDADQYVGTPTAASVRDAVARSDRQPFLSVTHDGIEVEAVTRPIPLSRWSLVIGAPTSVLTAGLRRSLIALGLGAAVSTAIGAGFVLWLCRHLVQEMAAASRASAALGDGMAPMVTPSSVRELEAIGAALETAQVREERVSHEMSALAESERRLAEANAALEIQARDLARSNAELEQFAYVASHDLREPLRMISAYTGLIERRYHDQFDADAREFLRFARDGARRMDEMVMNLLEFSRIGRRSDPAQPVALAEVVGEALDNLALAVEESGSRIEVADALPTIAGSRPDLVRLFQNLIANAIKFRHPDRAPTIRLGVAEDDHHWTWSVADNGIGIAPDHFDRIFQIFQRLHSRDKYDGTGIGLAVCRKVVEHHGGRIWVESDPGQGTTFLFTLPKNFL